MTSIPEKSKFQCFEWSCQCFICGDPPSFELSNSESENIRVFLSGQILEMSNGCRVRNG